MPNSLRLILLSCLMLFVELALIRWTGSNVIFLAYFSNFVLLGSFLGIGIGFLRARSRVNLFPYAPAALAIFSGLVLIFQVRIDRSGADVIYFGGFGLTGLPIWIMLPFIFVAVAAMMSMVAQEVARTFIRFDPLDAYRYDIAGSILGIAAFSILSFTWAPPVAWGIVASILFLALLRPNIRAVQVMGVIALVFVLGRESTVPEWSWSPYYRVEHTVPAFDATATEIGVNGIPYQTAVSVAYRRTVDPSVYFIPYQRAGNLALNNVLIIGAGSGTDVAIALAQGARHVDAVEIDPRIYQLGVQRHPDHPYADRRVTVTIDDARAFLERTDGRYDLILFAMPDALTLVSGQSSLRLESYLFTLEAVQQAKAHLRPNGAIAMYNYFREDWLIDRLAGTLQVVFDRPPCVDAVRELGRLAAISLRADGQTVGCPQPWTPTDPAAAATPSTDDHPFLYLRERSIPDFYLLTIALILLASLIGVRFVSGPLRLMRGYLDLFFMGAAFLLLETKSVVQFALLFGTTWFVNALVFAGVLVAVLLAIEVARRVSLGNPALLYAALLLAIGIALLIPPESLLALDVAPRFLAAVVIWCTPIFIANLVFAQRFQNVEASNVAFGANLLGAMVGGVLEYVSLLTGYQALLILVALLYGFAFIARPGNLRVPALNRAATR